MAASTTNRTPPVTTEVAPAVITALLAIGMALAFFIADRRSLTSRALALFLASIGVSMGCTVLLEAPLHHARGIPAWAGVFAAPEALAFVAANEWLLRVGRTGSTAGPSARGADIMLRVAQALAVFYGLASLAFPEMRAEHFAGVFLDHTVGESAQAFDRHMRIATLLFAVPLGASLVLAVASGLIMLHGRPDLAEALRMLAFVLAAPFLGAGLLLPPAEAPVATAIGLLVFLIGAVQYHVSQGHRAQFMARFLAPQVAELVRRRGLGGVMEEKVAEISVVCCDLRGFTAFSAATSSHKVMRILREYYDAVGAAASAFGGTIKDQTGDGVLILVGAPVEFPDHARLALQIADRIRTHCSAMAARWSDVDLQLGVGVGVASGHVTVGILGAQSRLEYAAVGPAVNLASRLCAEAAAAEVLVDQRTVELLAAREDGPSLSAGAALRLKGYQQSVPSFVLESS